MLFCFFLKAICLNKHNYAINYMLLTKFFLLTEKRNKETTNQYDLTTLSLYELVFGHVNVVLWRYSTFSPVVQQKLLWYPYMKMIQWQKDRQRWETESLPCFHYLAAHTCNTARTKQEALELPGVSAILPS